MILAATTPESLDPARFFTFLILAMAGSMMKVRLPGIEGTFSPDFLLILVGIVELGLGQTVVMAACCATMQSMWKAEKRPSLRQVAFNVASVSASVAMAHYSYHLIARLRPDQREVVMLLFAAAVYFAVNTLLVSGILSIVESKPILKVWQTWFLWAFPLYLVGAGIAIGMARGIATSDWKISLVSLPLMILAYISYRSIVRTIVRQHDAPGV